ncbi:MAG: pyridoxamine 5'-phosphate oxidase [Burkholderiaceae bacterium]
MTTTKTTATRHGLVSQEIADLREDYRLAELHESQVHADPLQQFRQWFDEAINAKLPEPNAMVVASVTDQGRPANRVLLLKGLDAQGFTFFTNYSSRKGAEFAHTPFAALTFPWLALERQVRIEGSIEKVSPAESDEYFEKRPLGSRLGAWASPQSSVIASRELLVENESRYREQYGDSPPRPEHWGGYRVVPDAIEFWQGRSSRLHDRLLFTRAQPGSPWTLERLAP